MPVPRQTPWKTVIPRHFHEQAGRTAVVRPGNGIYLVGARKIDSRTQPIAGGMMGPVGRPRPSGAADYSLIVGGDAVRPPVIDRNNLPISRPQRFGKIRVGITTGRAVRGSNRRSNLRTGHRVLLADEESFLFFPYSSKAAFHFRRRGSPQARLASGGPATFMAKPNRRRAEVLPCTSTHSYGARMRRPAETSSLSPRTSENPSGTSPSASPFSLNKTASNRPGLAGASICRRPRRSSHAYVNS